MKYILITYVFVGVIVFGMPYSNLIDSCENESRVGCNIASISGATLAASAWPLYLSVKYWSK